MDVLRAGPKPRKHQVLPIANAGYELDSKQIGEPADRGILLLGIGVHDIRLDVRGILQEPI